MYKINILNFLATFSSCLHSAQAKKICYISSYNGKVLPNLRSTTIWHPSHISISLNSFLKLGNIILADKQYIKFIYDHYSGKTDNVVEVSQKV
ncbi:hypothetical protein [Chryseobacterium sp. M5A1_1a]